MIGAVESIGAIDWTKTANAVSSISQGIQTVATSVQPFVNPTRTYQVNQVLQQQPTAPTNTTQKDNTVVYILFGVGAVALAGTAFYFLTRKRKKS
jgi:LPXTG-motif cell wall-anchored protein